MESVPELLSIETKTLQEEAALRCVPILLDVYVKNVNPELEMTDFFDAELDHIAKICFLLGEKFQQQADKWRKK